MKPIEDHSAAERMPDNMGVIWSAAHACPLVYTLIDEFTPAGERTGLQVVESVRMLGAAFLDLTPELLAAVEADRRKPAVEA